MSLFELEHVAKRYRGRPAVWAARDVTVSVDAGEIVGLVGPNGAGKTTSLAVAAGLIAQSGGVVRFAGEECPPRDPRRWLGAWVGEPGFYGHLSGVEHLRATLGLRGVRLSRSDAVALLERVGIGATEARRRVGDYSTGMRRRLAYAGATGAESAVLILDEPTSGLDPVGIRSLLDDLVDRADRGTAVLLSSHRLAEVESVCDRIYLISNGVSRELAHGSLGRVLRVRCSDPDSAVSLLDDLGAVRIGRTVVVADADVEIDTISARLRSGNVAIEVVEVGEATLEETFFIESKGSPA
jgi:ABC-type multidrug transport system ATPase subunit